MNEKKWTEEAEKLFKQKYPSYKDGGSQEIRSAGMPCLSHYYDGVKWGYLQACQVRNKEKQEEIEKLKDLIAEAGPLAWMMNDDIDGASEWEKKAFKIIGGKEK